MILLSTVAIVFLSLGSISGYFVLRDAERAHSPIEDRARLIGVGDKAPDFSLKNENGRLVSLGDFGGNVVLLNFWATWCGPCVEEAPRMEELKRILQDHKFSILTVSLDTEWGPIQRFFEDSQIRLPVVLDPGRQVARLYGVNALPTSFLIDENRRVVKQLLGPIDWSSAAVVSDIRSLFD